MEVIFYPFTTVITDEEAIFTARLTYCMTYVFNIDYTTRVIITVFTIFPTKPTLVVMFNVTTGIYNKVRTTFREAVILV